MFLMNRKLQLLKRAAKTGGAWAWAWGDHVGRLLTFYGLLVGASAFGVWQLGWGIAVLAVAVFGVTSIGAGALIEWDKAEKYVETHGEYLGAMEQLQGECFRHVKAVKRFLDAHELAGPPEPTDYFTKALAGGASKVVADSERRAIDQHRRSTVAEFIESDHLDRGIDLFNRLVRLRLIVDVGRPHIEQPRSVEQIRDGIQTIQIAAERAPVLR